jgi:hypothetical protein
VVGERRKLWRYIAAVAPIVLIAPFDILLGLHLPGDRDQQIEERVQPFLRPASRRMNSEQTAV